MQPNILSIANIKSSKHWYEKLPYTVYQSVLNTGRANLFSIDNIANSTQGTKIAYLSDLATTQSAGVMINVGHASEVLQMDSGAVPSALQPMMTRDDGFAVKSVSRLSLGLLNNTGAAVNNFQVNYSAASKTLNVAEKMMFGVKLTELEASLARKYKLGTAGVRPLPMSESLKRAFYGQIIDMNTYGFVVDAANAVSTIDNRVVHNDEIMVITKIAAQATPGNQVNLVLDRDDDLGLVSILADNMTLDKGFDVWIPVTSRYTLSVSSTTAENNIPVRVEALRIRKTTIINHLMGTVSDSSLTGEDLATIEKINAGVMI